MSKSKQDWEKLSKEADPVIKLTPLQWDTLETISKECLDPLKECTGGCVHGWYDPLTGYMLTAARRLADYGLVDLSNGTSRRAIAGHVTTFGHAALRVRESKRRKKS